MPVMTESQPDLDEARRALEIAYSEYERVTADLNCLPHIATQERAALTQLRIEAWNRLEAARLRYETMHKSAPKRGL